MSQKLLYLFVFIVLVKCGKSYKLETNNDISLIKQKMSNVIKLLKKVKLNGNKEDNFPESYYLHENYLNFGQDKIGHLDKIKNVGYFLDFSKEELDNFINDIKFLGQNKIYGGQFHSQCNTYLFSYNFQTNDDWYSSEFVIDLEETSNCISEYFVFKDIKGGLALITRKYNP